MVEEVDWCRKGILKTTGSFWLASGDTFASELDVMCRRSLVFIVDHGAFGIILFGVNCKAKFTPSHTHLFHYVVDKNNFKFNANAIKIPSARQTKYKDKRAKSGGRLPDDVWQFPRVCGTHKERQGWHPAQMPLSVVERIILTSTNEGDNVFDPFAGSGTTLIAALKHGRNCLGAEISTNYCDRIRSRMENFRNSHELLP